MPAVYNLGSPRTDAEHAARTDATALAAAVQRRLSNTSDPRGLAEALLLQAAWVARQAAASSTGANPRLALGAPAGAAARAAPEAEADAALEAPAAAAALPAAVA